MHFIKLCILVSTCINNYNHFFSEATDQILRRRGAENRSLLTVILVKIALLVPLESEKLALSDSEVYQVTYASNVDVE